jgi:hypothetical protein
MGVTPIAARESVVKYQMALKEDLFVEMKHFKIYAATWNVNGQSPIGPLNEWLAPDPDPPGLPILLEKQVVAVLWKRGILLEIRIYFLRKSHIYPPEFSFIYSDDPKTEHPNTRTMWLQDIFVSFYQTTMAAILF